MSCEGRGRKCEALQRTTMELRKTTKPLRIGDIPVEIPPAQLPSTSQKRSLPPKAACSVDCFCWQILKNLLDSHRLWSDYELVYTLPITNTSDPVPSFAALCCIRPSADSHRGLPVAANNISCNCSLFEVEATLLLAAVSSYGGWQAASRKVTGLWWFHKYDKRP